MTTKTASLTVGEAVMRVDLANLPAVMFHDAVYDRPNMIYRCNGGHFGWVDPQGTSEMK